VGRPQGKGPDVVDHVLSGFRKHEREELDLMLVNAVDAALLCLQESPQAAMNRFNADSREDRA
jgi:peptidyl-tRNA hydrolase